MSIRSWIQQWIGIAEIEENQSMQSRQMDTLLHKLTNIQRAVYDARSSAIVANRSMARIIAKLDPIFAGDEMSPQRKAESDKITEAVIAKLTGEHLASRMPGD